MQNGRPNCSDDSSPVGALHPAGGSSFPAQQRTMFLVTWATYAGYYFCRKNISIALPLLEGTKGITHLDLANIVFGYSLFYALGQFVCGVLSDRFGARLVVGAGLVLVVLSNLLMCLHGTSSWLLFFACVNGLGQSSGWSGLVKMMGSWFAGNRRGIVMAWWSTNYVLGGFLATAFATWSVTQPFLLRGLGWRRGFLFPALVVLALVPVFLLLARDSPAQQEPAQPKAAACEKPKRALSWRVEFFRLLRCRQVQALGTAYFFLELCRYALLFWLPYFLVNRLRLSLGVSGYVSSLYELAGVAGALLAGYVSDRFMESRRAPVCVMMMAGFGLMALLPVFQPHPGLVVTALWVSLAGMLTYGPDTLLSGAAAQDVGGELATATSSGLIDGLGHLGALFSPYLVVFVSARYGWNLLFLLFSGAAFVASLSLLPIWKVKAGGARAGQDGLEPA